MVISARKHSPTFGFTLIELLIVIAIIGILSAIAIPSFSSFNTNQRLSQAAKQVKQDLRSAQNRAVNNIDGKMWGIYFGGSGAYYIFACDNPSYDGYVDIKETLLTQGATASSPGGGPALIMFDQVSGKVYDLSGEVLSGIPSELTITLGGSERTITVSAGGKIEEQ